MSAPALEAATSRGAAQRALAQAFAAAGLDSPALDARLLLCAACGIRHAELVTDPDAPIGAEAAALLVRQAARRLAGEPVSRILGRREFWGLDFVVTPDVLDPRPDTETIVETALDELGGRRGDALRILDLGTGTGAILAALLAECPRAFGVAVDRSEAAALVAKANLERLGLGGRSAVLVGDWAGALSGAFDLVVSNPPYIPEAEIARLDREVRLHDPHAALSGGGDGFDAYRLVARDAARLLASGGSAVIEAGQGQAQGIADLLEAAGLAPQPCRADLAGIPRAVIGRRRGEAIFATAP